VFGIPPYRFQLLNYYCSTKGYGSGRCQPPAANLCFSPPDDALFNDVSSIGTSSFSYYVKRMNREYDKDVAAGVLDTVQHVKCLSVDVYQLMTDADRLCADIKRQFDMSAGIQWNTVAVPVIHAASDSLSANFDVGLSIEVAIDEELAAAVFDKY
jgi:hypothetical protein